MGPPKADKINHSFVLHGQEITDEYNWLRDRNWPNVSSKEIIEYLQAENNYTEQFFALLQKEKEVIFEELKGRIKLSDQSTYLKKDNNYYYTRTEEDKEYLIYCRKIGSTSATEEIILDVNDIVKDNKFTDVREVAISPNHQLIAYSVDHTGDERYVIKIYNLQTKEYLPDEITNVSGEIIWHEELTGFFYTPINQNFRHDTLMFHKLGTPISDDKLIFNITDTLYQLNPIKSASRRYIFINIAGHNDNAIHAIKMSDHSFKTVLIRAPKEGIFYDVEHNANKFYIKTNDKAKNFRIISVDVDNFQNDLWENDYVAEDPDKYLSSFYITNNYLLLNYRNQGVPFIKIKNLADNKEAGKEQIIDFPDESFFAESISTNFDEDDIRVNYSSLARPTTTYKYDFNNDKLSILKIQKIPSGFIPEDYMVERIFADNAGVKIPITLLYKKSLFKKDGSNPLYLYGYGSYGYSVPVSFRNSTISLVNRGFVYAIAHIRGGDELGHEWYEAAKFLNKKRSFSDFIATAEELIKKKYTNKGNIVICGGSAGGLLIGAVINERPSLFKAAIAHVPFVDMLNTMLDEELPLTPGEFKEWGNPKELEYFNYIKSYSPYDNIKPQIYPSLFITAGISDPRVGYWEAAKWVARIRATKTDDNILLLKTNMDSGHKGASGRFDYLKETADAIIFIFKIFDIIK
jgi:oligopeptidase B